MRILQLGRLISFLAMVLCLSGGPAWAAGKMIDLGTLGGNSSGAYAINKRGQIAGWARTSVVGESHAALYTDGAWQDLGTLGTGKISNGYGINDLGHVVGSSTISTSFPLSLERHAFLWTPEGGMIQLSNIPGTFSTALGINNSDQIVGEYKDTDNKWKGFLWSGGVMTPLTLGGGEGFAHAINDNGQVTGYGINSDNGQHAFLYDIKSKVMTDLGTMGEDYGYSVAWGLNDLGHVVGRSTISATSGYQHAFRYVAGDWTDLGVLSGDRSEAFGINNRGQIVGESYAVNAPQGHAFVYADGVMNDLHTLGWKSSARGINERGQIVGYYYIDTSMISRAFLCNPVVSVPGLFLLLE